jgi:hypothetical protein
MSAEEAVQYMMTDRDPQCPSCRTYLPRAQYYEGKPCSMCLRYGPDRNKPRERSQDDRT